MTPTLPETVLQFGAGKFLRCFADLFAHEANQGAEPAGRVVVVQSTGNQRARQINAQGGCYRVAIRGLMAGQRVDRVVEVASIGRALAAAEQWPEVLDVARAESLRTIVSNTTEAGYALDDTDRPEDAPPRSFPAKLLRVLRERQRAGLPGVTVLPCELYDGNAVRLLALVLEQAQRWRVESDTVDWLREACRWCNTLVDRIVSAPTPGDPLAAVDPLFAVAEPFALWLIECVPATFARRPAIQSVERLEPYALRKVRILNGAHTALVAKARPLGFVTVRQAVADAAVRAWLEELLFEEIVPVLQGRVDAPAEFARQTLERFGNPFLDHRLADIALHHEVKLQTRLVPTLAEFRQRFDRAPRRLCEVLP